VIYSKNRTRKGTSQSEYDLVTLGVHPNKRVKKDRVSAVAVDTINVINDIAYCVGGATACSNA
jgi:hypothetical protein